MFVHSIPDAGAQAIDAHILASYGAQTIIADIVSAGGNGGSCAYH